MAGLNHSIFVAINHWPEALAPTMRFFSNAMNYWWMKALIAALAIGLATKSGKTRRTAVQALIAFPLSDGTTNLLKHIFPMPRPFQELPPHEVILRLGWSDSAGTASAHSANMAVVAYVFVYHLGWAGSPWILVALLTGLSRVYNGVHYPYQVLLGWTCGILIGFSVTKIGELILRSRRNVETAETSDEAKES